MKQAKYKFTMKARRWDQTNYLFIVYANNISEATAMVRSLASDTLPNPREKEIIVEFVSMEECQ